MYYIDSVTGKYIGSFVSVDAENHPIAPPDGAIQISAPPDHGTDVLIGFSVSNGAAVGGTWNTSARPIDGDGFTQAIKSAMGGVVAANALAKQYPLFYPAIQLAEWSDLQALIIDAHNTSVLNDTQYGAFKTLAAQFNIPVTLP